MGLVNQCFLVKNRNGEPVAGALVMGMHKTGALSWEEQYCRTNTSGICCLDMKDNVPCKAWIEESPAGYAYLEDEQDFSASSSQMREFVLPFSSEFMIDQEFAAQDNKNVRLEGVCIRVGTKTCTTIGKYVGNCHIQLQAGNEYIAELTDFPKGYEYPGGSKTFTPSLTKVVMFTFKKMENHCYNAAGELVMSHGEEKCVSGDLYICLDGILTPHPRHPDCKEVVVDKKSACPIACVCMGTPLIDALGPIREFRDFVLKRSWLGRCFVSFYYTQVGPFLSLALVRSETLRKAGRWVVRRILRRLDK